MFADFINMIFPHSCLTCNKIMDKNEELICTHCRYELPKTDFHLHKDNPLARKLWGRIQLEYAFAYLRFIKTGKVQMLLHHLKYYGKQEIGEILGKWYANDLNKSNLTNQFDIILPVPLHPSKLAKRGYNQCDSIAKGMAEGLGIQWNAHILIRKKANISQTKQERIARFENVEAIFEIQQAEKIQGKRVLLVDDVITTGATIEACGIPIIEAGCQSLSIASLAVAYSL
jgi:ComF family protein